MTEKPRLVNFPDWCIFLLAKIRFVINNDQIGTQINLNTGKVKPIVTDTTHEQLIYLRSRDGSILKRSTRNRWLFFHDQTKVQPIDPPQETDSDFSDRPKVDIEEKWRKAGGDLKSPPKTGGFGFKR